MSLCEAIRAMGMERVRIVDVSIATVDHSPFEWKVIGGDRCGSKGG